MKYIGVIIDHKLKWCEHIYHMLRIKYLRVLALFSKQETAIRSKMFTYPL